MPEFDQSDMHAFAFAKEVDLRGAAIELLADQMVLAQIAIETSLFSQIPDKARKKLLENPEGKAALEKMKIIENEKLNEVSKLTDQTELIKLALEDYSLSMRRAAVFKLTDQSVLTQIAIGDDDWNVRIPAIFRLTDQSLLFKFAMGDLSWWSTDGNFEVVRELMVDQELLAKLAMGAPDYKVRLESVKKLTDLKLLARVAVQDNFDGTVNQMVRTKLEESPESQEIFEDMKKVYIKRLANVESITDQKELAKIAREDDWWEVRRKAVIKVTDQYVLGKCARFDKDYRVQSSAVTKITEQSILNEIALNSETEIKNTAINRIKLLGLDVPEFE